MAELAVPKARQPAALDVAPEPQKAVGEAPVAALAAPEPQKAVGEAPVAALAAPEPQAPRTLEIAKESRADDPPLEALARPVPAPEVPAPGGAPIAVPGGDIAPPPAPEPPAAAPLTAGSETNGGSVAAPGTAPDPQAPTRDRGGAAPAADAGSAGNPDVTAGEAGGPEVDATGDPDGEILALGDQGGAPTSTSRPRGGPLASGVEVPSADEVPVGGQEWQRTQDPEVAAAGTPPPSTDLGGLLDRAVAYPGPAGVGLVVLGAVAALLLVLRAPVGGGYRPRHGK